ncbi:MAG: hypothetical protein V4644_03120 [Patescibacteria group bacterium]
MSEAEVLSPEVSLQLFAKGSALFKRYGNYLDTRISTDTGKPTLEPITELREALVLLYEHGSSERRIHLDLNRSRADGTIGPVLRISVFGGGYLRDELTAEYDLIIAGHLVTELKQSGLLSGTPHMGYTDETELRLSEQAPRRILEEMEKYAQVNPESEQDD